jgi:hypothetical protein
MRRAFEAGDRREAIRQFERLRDALREHIGVGPDRTTVALYEQVLAMEGEQPPTPVQRAAVLLANGLLAWNRRALEDAERLAREARGLALDAGAGHELGEAATLLALVAYARDNWHDLFLQDFAESVRRPPEQAQALYDAHLCFSELYLYGPEWHKGTSAFACELLSIAAESGSVAGEGLARLLLGEYTSSRATRSRQARSSGVLSS